MLIVYRTASLLYKVLPDRIERLCTYSLNPRKSPAYKNDSNNKYSNNSRFYFTSARIELLFNEGLIQRVQMFNEKLKQYSNAHNISEGGILLKYMRDFIEYGGPTQGEYFIDDLFVQLDQGTIGAGETEEEMVRPSRNNLQQPVDSYQ